MSGAAVSRRHVAFDLALDTPAAPSRLVATEVGHDYASVAWEAGDDGGALCSGFIVEKRELNRRVFQRAGQTSGQRNNSMLDELEMDTTYEIRVAAFNRFGIGDFSDTVCVTTGVPYVAPSIFTAPTVTLVNDQVSRRAALRLRARSTSDGCRNWRFQSVTLDWEHCSESGGSRVYSYDVYQRELDSNGDWTRANSDAIFVCNYTVRILRPGATYAFKVEVTSEANLTSNSNVASDPITMPRSFGESARRFSGRSKSKLFCLSLSRAQSN